MVRHTFLRQQANPWLLLPTLVALLISLPLVVVVGSLFAPAGEHWQHMLVNLVPDYVRNTAWLLAGVAVLTLLIGVSTAWLVTAYEFPGRRVYEWALILPLAIPGYIAGFVYAGILDYTSPLYTFFRNRFDIHTGQYFLFDMLSLPGAIFIFSLTLYPYVYLICRAYFAQQSATLAEVSASLGRSPLPTFLRVIIPVARPALVAGVSLVLMEVLNDYGLVRYFGIDTFTTGIFTAWFAFNSLNAALRLSAFLLAFVLLLIALERFHRRRLRYTTGRVNRPPARHTPRKLTAALFSATCLAPLLLGFVVPFTKLLYWSLQVLGDLGNLDFWRLLLNSFLLAVTAAVLVVMIAVVLAYSLRTFPNKLTGASVRLATLGYALPGAVVAMGLLVTLLWWDRHGPLWQLGLPLTLTGTWPALIFAYCVRFMAVGYNTIESGYQRIPLSLDQSSRSLGRSKLATLWKVNLPLLQAPLIAGGLLVFIDVLKELPLTLILRPFNFDTLAIRSFEFASDERVAEAAPAAVVIVLTGLLPILLLNRLLGRSES